MFIGRRLRRVSGTVIHTIYYTSSTDGMRACGKRGEQMFIKKRKMDIGLEKDFENAVAENEAMKAFIDYNVMMGNIEDPAEDEEEGEE